MAKEINEGKEHLVNGADSEDIALEILHRDPLRSKLLGVEDSIVEGRNKLLALIDGIVGQESLAMTPEATSGLGRLLSGIAKTMGETATTIEGIRRRDTENKVAIDAFMTELPERYTKEAREFMPPTDEEEKALLGSFRKSLPSARKRLLFLSNSDAGLAASLLSELGQ